MRNVLLILLGIFTLGFAISMVGSVGMFFFKVFIFVVVIIVGVVIFNHRDKK